ncbi:MAG: hypothetical protein RR313_11225 [Anaerovoracaceae bacterium]
MLIVSTCGLIAFFTDGFTTDFTSFYIECEGRQIMSYASGYSLTNGKTLTVKVKYAFSSANTIKDYYVKVVPKTDINNNFDFSLDGNIYSFCDESDFTNGFNITKQKDCFTISAKGNLEEILKAVYPTFAVEVKTKNIDFTKELFTLMVMSYDKKSNVLLNFTVDDFRVVNDIILDKEELKF